MTARGSFDDSAFLKEFGLPVTRIGEVEDGDVGVDLIIGGERVAPPAGYDHFSQ